VKGSVEFYWKVKSCKRLSLAEIPQKSLPVNGSKIDLTAKPGEIITLGVEFKERMS
jgi:hypothetical protein